MVSARVRDRIVAAAIAAPQATPAELAAELGTNVGTTRTVLSQWRNGYFPDLPPSPTPGANYEPEFIDIDVRCVCGATQTETVPGDDPARAVLARIKCRACERVGSMSLLCTACHPQSRDPEL